jgi:hypothetical protein
VFGVCVFGVRAHAGLDAEGPSLRNAEWIH